MTISIDVSALDDEHEQRRDYRRANGSPLVSDPSDPSKSLRYRRPSSYGKPLDSEEALTEWRIWKAMEGVARSPALQAQVASCKDDDRAGKKALREGALDKGAANEKADLGTGLHAMTARVEDASDVDFDPPEQFAADLKAYTDELDRLGLVSEYVECHIVNDDFRAAGTADRVYRLTKPLLTPDGVSLPAGTLVLGDIKTGAKMDFGLPAYCVQMAIYATGQFYDIHTESRIATPAIDRQWMMLMHLPVGKSRCDALWLNINTGLHGAYLTFEVLEWRNRWKSGSTHGYNSYEIADPWDAEGAVIEAFDAVPVDATSPKAIVDWCQVRITAIGQHAAAKRQLMLTWPDGLPTPKRGITEPGDIIRLLDLLDAIEKVHSLPFVGGDPRITRRNPDRIPGDLP